MIKRGRVATILSSGFLLIGLAYGLNLYSELWDKQRTATDIANEQRQLKEREYELLGAKKRQLLENEKVTSFTTGLQLSTSGTLAVRILLRSHYFSTGCVGIGCDYPDEAWALMILLGERDGSAVFKAIANTNTTDTGIVPALYAVCGLWFTDPSEFNNQVAKLQTRHDAKVETLIGCMGGEADLKSILHGGRNELNASIMNGEASKRLRDMGAEMMTSGTEKFDKCPPRLARFQRTD